MAHRRSSTLWIVVFLSLALVSTLLVTPSQSAGAPSDRYLLKIKRNLNSDTQFTVYINDRQVGIFSSNTSFDVTHFLKKGSNRVRIVTTRLRPKIRSYAILTIGALHEGKWGTALSHTVYRNEPSSERLYSLHVF